MLAEAKREAERIVADARDKAAQEASEQEVVKRAEREAADILEEARQREREVRLGRGGLRRRGARDARGQPRQVPRRRFSAAASGSRAVRGRLRLNWGRRSPAGAGVYGWRRARHHRPPRPRPRRRRARRACGVRVPRVEPALGGPGLPHRAGRARGRARVSALLSGPSPAPADRARAGGALLALPRGGARPPWRVESEEFAAEGRPGRALRRRPRLGVRRGARARPGRPGRGTRSPRRSRRDPLPRGLRRPLPDLRGRTATPGLRLRAAEERPPLGRPARTSRAPGGRGSPLGRGLGRHDVGPAVVAARVEHPPGGDDRPRIAVGVEDLLAPRHRPRQQVAQGSAIRLAPWRYSSGPAAISSASGKSAGKAVLGRYLDRREHERPGLEGEGAAWRPPRRRGRRPSARGRSPRPGGAAPAAPRA